MSLILSWEDKIPLLHGVAPQKGISGIGSRPETLGSPCKDPAGATDHCVIPCVPWAWTSGDIMLFF